MTFIIFGTYACVSLHGAASHGHDSPAQLSIAAMEKRRLLELRYRPTLSEALNRHW